MFRHNLIVILRNFKKYKSTFLINLLGLSTGLACAILIALWVMDESRIDKFHSMDDRLYRVMVNMERDGKIETAALGVALLTVGIQAIRAAQVNPVQCLKEE